MMKRLTALAALCLLALPVYAASVIDPNIDDDGGSYALGVIPHRNTLVLAANTEETFTVPTFTLRDGSTPKAGRVFFAAEACDDGFWVNYDATATVPSSDITDGTSSEPNPTVRWLRGAVTTLHVKSSSSCIVSMQFTR